MVKSTTIATAVQICVVSTLLAPVLMDRQDIILPMPKAFAEQESEHDYDEELLNFDWSLLQGEQMPRLDDSNDDFKAAEDGALYLSNGEEEDSLESWVDQVDDGTLTSKMDVKRGFNVVDTRKKKNQVLCRVLRTVHHHNEDGHEFFPRSYTGYTCHPVGPTLTDQISTAQSSSHDSCYVLGSKCITIEKEQLFFKKLHNTNCWSHFVEAVGAGCKCLSRKF
ncbi:uncharacterized protein [Euwallacea similis]|uniref:uncharacterized protein isoform X2 n=1 Tax=Euwallacea similis TaxID=1736056 RepID=UPI00344CB37F